MAITIRGRWVAMALAAGCSREVRYRQVPVRGLPQCDQSQGANILQRPVLLQIDHPGGQLRQTFSGAETRPTVSLAERADPITVRVAVCEYAKPGDSAVRCAHPTWVGEPQRVTLDPRASGAAVTVSMTDPAPCVR